ncbi:phosphotransferase-like protein [Streptomyces misionensis]|uniref:phosphotransferase-like protein n=1 Tax=Streptomyces misionensis TaxID=67331 RepID=UPI0028F6FB68|nr:hypothetical protein [Streptomyces misionensis]
MRTILTTWCCVRDGCAEPLRSQQARPLGGLDDRATENRAPQGADAPARCHADRLASPVREGRQDDGPGGPSPTRSGRPSRTKVGGQGPGLPRRARGEHPPHEGGTGPGRRLSRRVVDALAGRDRDVGGDVQHHRRCDARRSASPAHRPPGRPQRPRVGCHRDPGASAPPAPRDDRPVELTARQLERVHAHGLYDVEYDTITTSPQDCARRVSARLPRRLTRRRPSASGRGCAPT